MFSPRYPQLYSRAEYISDAAIHISGLTSALIAAPTLVLLAAIWVGEGNVIAAISIYALFTVAMLACSALYNMVPVPAWKDRLRRLDQSAIFLKIAATYTPIVALTGAQAGGLLAGVWGVALAGASAIVFGPPWLKPLGTVAFVGLGWAGAIWGGPLVSLVGPASFTLLLIGGILYTVGVLFLLWQRLPHHNTIWHIFVLAATALLYGAIYLELVARAAA
jgi:hemolysin III